MAEYHGDIMHKTGNFYESRDESNYLVAIMLLVLLGWIGGHRFYLNNMGIAWAYFVSFAVASFASFMMLDFSVLIGEMALAGFFLTIELGFFIYKWLHQ